MKLIEKLRESYAWWLFRRLVDDTPRRNLRQVGRWVGEKLGVSRAKGQKQGNMILDSILESPSFPIFLAHAAQRLEGSLVFAGQDQMFAPVIERLRSRGRSVEWIEFDWGRSAAALAASPGTWVILGLLPVTVDEWEQVVALRRELNGRLVVLTELLLPYASLSFLQRRLDYYFKEPGQILPYYLGERFFGPLDLLDQRFPLRGKSVIEFGPFEGCQTAGLVHFGAARVTCIESRPENALKTRAAAEAFRWPQVQVIMDDLHNAEVGKYGRHDLAFAHGVYYHAIAPFVFLENLCSLSATVFLGGYCATDESPPSPWIELHHRGRTYRAKQYRETSNFTAGVNQFGYFLHGEDLQRFFRERGFQVEIISEESSKVTAGQHLRFLARSGPVNPPPEGV